jgi:hypothetical protein
MASLIDALKKEQKHGVQTCKVKRQMMSVSITFADVRIGRVHL